MNYYPRPHRVTVVLLVQGVGERTLFFLVTALVDFPMVHLCPRMMPPKSVGFVEAI